MVFFGYTQCPDVCPTTLADARRGDEAARPGRGSRAGAVHHRRSRARHAALLAQYVPAFDPRFLGLCGDADATARTAKEFRIIYQKVPGPTPGSYTMDHSAGSYVFDPQGRLRLFVSNGQGPDVFAHDLRELLRGSST